MRKTSRKGRDFERLRRYFLHRECVRRNQNYIKAYRQLQGVTDERDYLVKEIELAKKWGLRWDEQLPDPEYLPEESEPPWRLAAINTRQSKRELTESLLEMADEIFANRVREKPKPPRPTSRLRLEEGFNYLKVYDLAEAGMRHFEIGVRLG